MPPHFQDHFSVAARDYAAFRPNYPAELFDYLAKISPAHGLAWDCACGSGQATQALAARFAQVVATDASAAQIAAAPALPNVTYRVAPAEESGLETASVHLITVAQALHWFGLARFYAETARVLTPGGVLAAWTYGVLRLDEPALDAPVQHFYATTLGPYWPPERKLVEEGYRTLPFPPETLSPPNFEMHTQWALPQLLGYFRSWSATNRFISACGYDPVVEIADKLLPLWGNPENIRRISWPLSLRVSQKPAA